MYVLNIVVGFAVIGLIFHISQPLARTFDGRVDTLNDSRNEAIRLSIFCVLCICFAAVSFLPSLGDGAYYAGARTIGIVLAYVPCLLVRFQAVSRGRE